MFFFFNDTATTEIYTLSLHDALPIFYAALLLYYTLENDKVSVKDKAIIIGALGYLISPLDMMPDAIPIAGLGDDLAVLIYVLHKVWGEVSDEVKDKARQKLATWFDESEVEAVDDIFTERPEDTPV